MGEVGNFSGEPKTQVSTKFLKLIENVDGKVRIIFIFVRCIQVWRNHLSIIPVNVDNILRIVQN